MKKLLMIILLSILSLSYASSQVLILAVAAVAGSAQPADKKLMSNLKGDWIFSKAEINGEDVLSQFEGVMVSFPKCKGKAYKEGTCQEVEVTGDDNTDYFKELFREDSQFTITSRKEINKAAAAEDQIYEKVMYETVSTSSSDYEFAFKYKKETMYIEAKGADLSEKFEMVRPPKVKKSKNK